MRISDLSSDVCSSDLGHPLELGGDLLGLATALQVVGLELRALRLEAGEIVLRRPHRLFLRQEVIAREARLDRHDVAHLPELLDALHPDHLHVSFSCLPLSSARTEAETGRTA